MLIFPGDDEDALYDPYAEEPVHEPDDADASLRFRAEGEYRASVFAARPEVLSIWVESYLAGYRGTEMPRCLTEAEVAASDAAFGAGQEAYERDDQLAMAAGGVR